MIILKNFDKELVNILFKHHKQKKRRKNDKLNALEDDRNEIPKVLQKVDAIQMKILEIGNNVK